MLSRTARPSPDAAPVQHGAATRAVFAPESLLHLIENGRLDPT